MESKVKESKVKLGLLIVKWCLGLFNVVVFQHYSLLYFLSTSLKTNWFRIRNSVKAISKYHTKYHQQPQI